MGGDCISSCAVHLQRACSASVPALLLTRGSGHSLAEEQGWEVSGPLLLSGGRGASLAVSLRKIALLTQGWREPWVYLCCKKSRSGVGVNLNFWYIKLLEYLLNAPSKLGKITYWVGLPDIYTDCEKNSFRATLQRRTWGSWWTKSWAWSSSVCLQSRRPTVSWAATKESQQGAERHCPPMFCPCEDPFGVLHSSLGLLG